MNLWISITYIMEFILHTEKQKGSLELGAFELANLYYLNLFLSPAV